MSLPERFGFSEFTTWPWSFREDVSGFARAGATVMEICEFKLAYHDYGEMLAQLPERGLSVASVQMNVHSVYPDSMASRPEDPADRIADMKRAIVESAPRLPRETPFVVISGVAPKGDIRRAFDCTVEALKELGEVAMRHGVRIAFEPLNPVSLHTDTAIWGLDQGLEVVDRVAHPGVGLCLDTWNVWQTPELSSCIAQAAKYLRLVQLSDWRRPRAGSDRYSLGTGDIPLTQIVRDVRAGGYDGPWVVELLSAYQLPDSLWKRDLDALLRENREAFARIWEETNHE